MMNDQCKITRRIMNALEQELLYLQTTRSREVEAMLAEAMEYGDLENNLEYDFAKAEQEKVSGRIAQIEKILSSAVIVEEEEKHLSDEFLAALRKLIQDCGLSGEQAEQYAKYVAEAYEERNRMEYDRFPEENCLQTLKEAQRICAGRSKGETLSAHMIDRFLRVPCEQWQMAKTAVSQYFGCGEDAVDRLYSENEEWLLVSAASASALAEQLLALFDADLSWRIFRNAALLGTEAAMTRISAVLDLMGEEFGGKVIRADAEADGWLFYRYYSDPVGCIAYMKTCGLTAEGILKAVQNDPLVLYLYKEDRRLSYNHDQAYIDKIIRKYK